MADAKRCPHCGDPMRLHGVESPVQGPGLSRFFHTRLWRKMHGDDDGETGVDNGIAEQGFAGIGAWILGRNMFGPVRGPWPDDSWKGWWGDEPPYWAMNARSTFRANVQLTSFCASARDT